MESYKENDKYLPIANIGRIMKKPLHENAKIAKEAKEIVQICVSEFISFVTSEACEKCNNEKRKTITGEDILYAIKELGFSNYLDILKVYLHKYRNSNKNQMMITDRQNYESQIFHEQLDYQSIFHNNKNNFNNHFQNLDLKYDSQYFSQHNSKNFNDQLRIKNNENVDFNIQSNNQSNQFINNIDNENSVHYFKKQDEIIFHDDSDFPLSRNSFFQ